MTYHSNTIEGNTLSLRETQMVIDYGLTIGGHPLREYLEATNNELLQWCMAAPFLKNWLFSSALHLGYCGLEN